MNCRICNSPATQAFTTTVLFKYEVSYYRCTVCGFLQTEKPYWLAEAYQNPINLSDTGIILRNQRLSKITTSLIFLFFKRKEKMLDYAGGYGIYTRMMRDIGFDFYWSDPYTENILARSFESEAGRKYYLATSFESFEHFDNPVGELEKIASLADNIILSTELLPQPMPPIGSWWYYAPEHGQHVAFYTKGAFRKLADIYHLNYYNLDNIHLLTRKKISFLGTLFFSFPYAKHVLYVLYFFISPFLKSKTLDDLDEINHHERQEKQKTEQTI